MNTESSQIPCRSLLPGFGLLLTLASCGAGHVGEAWQCPLTQGSQCISVERADPAIRPVEQPAGLAPLVLDPAGMIRAEQAETILAVDVDFIDDSRIGDAQAQSEPCRSRCNPMGRFWRWLTGHDSRAAASGDVGTEAAPPTETPADQDTDSPDVPTVAETLAPAPSDSALETPLPQSPQEPQTPAVADVRVPEKIGRVWIAPWVDASGVYREGAWVRVVLSPATWRRPH